MRDMADSINEANARCLNDYVHYIQKNYNNEELLRGFYAFGEWSLDERPTAEKLFKNAVAALLTEPDQPCFSWALKIASDHYTLLKSPDTEKYWSERAIVGEVIRRTEEGVAKTSQQLLKRKSYDFRDRTLNQAPTPPQQRRKTSDIKEHDGLNFEGLDASLMTIILKKGAKEETNTAKGRYRKAISMNNVVDLSDTLEDGQLYTAVKDKSIVTTVIEALASDPKINTIRCDQMINIVKKIDSSRKVKKALMKIYNVLGNSKAKGTNSLVARLFCHIVELHAYDNLVFNAGIIGKLSECSYIVKIWGPFIEKTMAGTEILTQWGDTVPDNFKGINNQQIKHPKIDLRLMCVATDIDGVDLGVGEFAKSIRPTKYLIDKTKMIICNKAQLNACVKALKPKEEEIKQLALPMVQIMGLQAEVSTLRLVSKGAYVIQKVAKCTVDRDPAKLYTTMQPVIQLLYTIKTLAIRAKDQLESFTKHTNASTTMESFTTTNTTDNIGSSTSWIRDIKEPELSE